MESEQMRSRNMKVEVMSSSSGVEFQLEGGAPNVVNVGQGGLMRQPSMTKSTDCLCSPTTHAGSFRCRVHRTPTLHRTKSMESESVVHHASMVDHADANSNKDQIH